MYTQESFCNAVWGTTFIKIDGSYSKDDYKDFSIPKKGGIRNLSYLPKASVLYTLQAKLVHNLLAKISLPTCAIGFRRNESYKSYLLPHVGNEYYLRIDIKDFFPSITDKLIASELACFLSLNTPEETDKIITLITDIVTRNGVLPQGASTSPAISNIVMARIDQRILKYCQVFDITYTRYADDLLFSSPRYDFSQKKWFFKKIKYILKSSNFRINHTKIKYAQKELSLNGYVISHTDVRLSRKRLSDIRHVVSKMQKNHSILIDHGSDAFLDTINSLPLYHRDLSEYPFKSLFLLLQYLCGYRAFLISWIDSNSLTAFQKELKHLIARIEKVIKEFS